MIKLAWGTLALFAATLALKFEYLRSAYQGKGISFIVTEMSKGNDLPALLIAMQIISQDVLEVILLGSLTLLLVRATPRAARPATYIAVSAFLLALLGLNHLSFTEIGTFASYETLVTAVVFVTSYGTMAANYFTPKTAAFFAIGMMCITFSPTTFWLCSKRPLWPVHKLRSR